jgi:hypothetical protein
MPMALTSLGSRLPLCYSPFKKEGFYEVRDLKRFKIKPNVHIRSFNAHKHSGTVFYCNDERKRTPKDV